MSGGGEGGGEGHIAGLLASGDRCAAGEAPKPNIKVQRAIIFFLCLTAHTAAASRDPEDIFMQAGRLDKREKVSVAMEIEAVRTYYFGQYCCDSRLKYVQTRKE